MNSPTVISLPVCFISFELLIIFRNFFAISGVRKCCSPTPFVVISTRETPPRSGSFCFRSRISVVILTNRRPQELYSAILILIN